MYTIFYKVHLVIASVRQSVSYWLDNYKTRESLKYQMAHVTS